MLASEIVKPHEERMEFEKGVILTEEEKIKLRKANKVVRLKALAEKEATISFVVETPGTTHDRMVHAVMLKNFCVRETKDGNFIVTGLDVEETLKADIERGIDSLSVFRKRDSDNSEIRTYRIDRIVNGTITWS